MHTAQTGLPKVNAQCPGLDGEGPEALCSDVSGDVPCDAYCKAAKSPDHVGKCEPEVAGGSLHCHCYC